MELQSSNTRHSFFAKLASLVLVAGLVGISVVASKSDGGLPSPVSSWYTALQNTDRAGFDALLSEDVVVELKSLELVQDKTEFIESMDAWEGVMPTTKIRTRLEEQSEQSAQVIVCYDFTANSQLVRETFRFNDNRINLNIQETIAENCDSF